MSTLWRSAARSATTAAASQLTKSSKLHTIQAIPREHTGPRVATRERSMGKIPAVVFSQRLLEKDPNARPGEDARKRVLTTERKQINKIVKDVKFPYFCSTRVGLDIRAGAGSDTVLESGKVLPIKVHRDEKSGKVLNLVFVWAEDGTHLKVDVPIVLKGVDECVGLKKGGHLNRVRTTLKYICPAELIPSKIEVDVSNLDIGDRIFMRDLEVHPSLQLLSKNDNMPICKVVATRVEDPQPMVVATQVEDPEPVAA